MILKDNYTVVRSSRPEVFYEKGVLINFKKFTGKHLYYSLFFNKVDKKRLWYRYFPVNFAKFLRTSFVTEHFRWLLLRGLDLIFLSEYFLSILKISSQILVKFPLWYHKSPSKVPFCFWSMWSICHKQSNQLYFYMEMIHASCTNTKK